MGQVDPHWTGYVTAISLPLVALIGACIAFLQLRTAQQKLKLDHFERREAVYIAARDAITIGATVVRFTDEQHFDFMVKTQSARWLFGYEVHDYLQTVLRHVESASNVNNAMSIQKHDPTALLKGMEEREKLREWFKSEAETMHTKFSRYLKLSR